MPASRKCPMRSQKGIHISALRIRVGLFVVVSSHHERIDEGKELLERTIANLRFGAIVGADGEMSERKSIFFKAFA
jgi:hypothetical protein